MNNSVYTTKHYEPICDVIRKINHQIDDAYMESANDPQDQIQWEIAKAISNAFVNDLVEMFANDNHRFNEKQFRILAGINIDAIKMNRHNTKDYGEL